MAEDPITIKGGSIEIEFHDTFDPITAPTRKRKFKHKKLDDAILGRVEVTFYDGRPVETINLARRDTVKIYYDAPENAQQQP